MHALRPVNANQDMVDRLLQRRQTALIVPVNWPDASEGQEPRRDLFRLDVDSAAGELRVVRRFDNVEAGRVQCSLGVPGDLLFVREALCLPRRGKARTSHLRYAADMDEFERIHSRFQPARKMAREHSRLTLLIKAAHARRFSALSEADILATGLVGAPDSSLTASDAGQFREQWDGYWHLRDEAVLAEADPMVWVVRFETFEANCSRVRRQLAHAA